MGQMYVHTLNNYKHVLLTVCKYSSSEPCNPRVRFVIQKYICAMKEKERRDLYKSSTKQTAPITTVPTMLNVSLSFYIGLGLLIA